MTSLPIGFTDPPRDYSLTPFWFWNDDLDADEIRRQIDDFHDHGVYAFVIHPRVGLPRSLSFMSESLLEYMRIAVEYAEACGMWVILYDEGMYPSGAAGGLVVAADPAYACRGLVKVPWDDERVALDSTHQLITTFEQGDRLFAIIDQPIDSWIRGLHYLDHDAPREPGGECRFDPDQIVGPPITAEHHPPAADLLNPDAVAAFIRIVYDGYAHALGDYFGSTIRAIFTDEPMVLGRGNSYCARPGNRESLEHVHRWFGRDITHELPLLWQDTPVAQQFAEQYDRAIKARLEKTYYQPLHDWCQAHGVNLTGHPHHPDDLGLEQYFHWPGQDVIWHEIKPGPSATRGRPSTQAKVAASAKAHHNRSRNANEYMGAYGHKVSIEQLDWITHWLLVRGCDLLIPHAFFYSIRGPRIDECPPQLGPHGKFWENFKPYADACRRLCWLNGTGQPIVRVAVLALSDRCPFDVAEALFERQIDFHYLAVDLLANAVVDEQGISINGFQYEAVILDDLYDLGESIELDERLHRLVAAGRMITWKPAPRDRSVSLGHVCEDSKQLASTLRQLGLSDVVCDPIAPGLRVRHVEIKRDGSNHAGHWYMIWNESQSALDTKLMLSATGDFMVIDPRTLDARDFDPHQPICFLPGQMKLLYTSGDSWR